MKKKSIIIAHIIIVTLSVSQLLSQSTRDQRAMIKADGSLVVPGIGAEKILLGEYAKEILTIKGYPDRIASFSERKELFAEIFELDSPVKIYFDKIYYYRSKDAIVFIENSIISSIIGLNSYRITDDAVNLNNGTEYFIFNYGNTGMRTLSKKENRIYLYEALGIAVVDDRNDNTIDMYIIFMRPKRE
jgi:hypothetical protein